MADEDLIFRLEGVDGGRTPRAGHAGDSDVDSEDEEGYFICPITDDPRSHQHINAKVNACYGNLTKSGGYGSSGSPAGSFNFKVSRPRPRDFPVFANPGPRTPDLRLGLPWGWGGVGFTQVQNFRAVFWGGRLGPAPGLQEPWRRL